MFTRTSLLTFITAMIIPAVVFAATATFSLTTPDATIASSGDTVTLNIRATFDAPLVATRFTLTATGSAIPTVTARSANPTTPAGLTFLSLTSQSPFDTGLPHTLTTPLTDVLLDMNYDNNPGSATDGLTPTTDALIETLTITLTGNGAVTITLTNPTAATNSETTPTGQLFDTVAINPASTSVSFTLDQPGDLDNDGDVDLNDYTLLVTAITGPNTNTTNPAADLDDDNDVDLADVAIFAQEFTTP